MRFEFTGGLSGLNLYKQYIAVIIKREVNALPLPEKLSNRSYQNMYAALSELHAKKVVVGVIALKLFPSLGENKVL